MGSYLEGSPTISAQREVGRSVSGLILQAVCDRKQDL